MFRLLTWGLFFCFVLHSHKSVAQPRAISKNHFSAPAEFIPLVKFFQERRALYQYDDKPLSLPIIFKEDSARVGMNYKLLVGKKSLGFKKREIVLKNPFGTSCYPLSYSVIYQGNLVTLFEPGFFTCYNVTTLTRNPQFERQLNKRKFEYHWVLDKQLVALANGRYFVYISNGTWAPYTKAIPFLAKQPKLFEDDQYLSFLTCNGEFGGEVYFYNKHTGHYYLTGSTCPNSITKYAGLYQVLASLGHGGGSARLQTIKDPAKLIHRQPLPSKGVLTLPKHTYNNVAPADRSTTTFYYYGIQLFGSFTWLGHHLYVVHWGNRTFLATIFNNNITIIDPLFNRSLYTHQPITTNYGQELVLMNLDFYGQAREREVCCLLFSGNQITRIDWGQKRTSWDY